MDMALHQGEGPILLRDIAKRQQIPLPYLKHLIAPLVAGGILRSTRGARGGLLLIQPPKQVKLIDIIILLEGSIAPVECVSNPEICDRSMSCATRDIWTELKDAMEGVLESTTLQDLVDRHKEKEQPETAMYHI